MHNEFKLWLEQTYGGTVCLCGFLVYLPDVFQRAQPEEYQAALEVWLESRQEDTP
jgi:hypothetical protein